MSEWLISLEGTEAGHRLALILAVNAAFLHAVFGALQKGRHDPWLSRGAIDGAYGLMAAPFALFVVPWPEPHMWPIFAGAFVIHVGYKLLQALAYTKGAYTVVYPVVRGTGPLFAVIGAWLLFDELFTPVQWLGVAVLLSGIFGLAVYNLIFLQSARDTLWAALGYALMMEVTDEITGGHGDHAGFGAGQPDFWIGTSKAPASGVHLAFRADSRATVRAFHAAALATGGRDNGAPGLRPQYHPDDYGAFVLDPDGDGAAEGLLHIHDCLRVGLG